ncbi:hypothetical protein O181_031047 [Austropuccinia psidii MF-1]|uniref:BZIP domain-containing protein n=1 Tax=Austropuccinia psidii MF-1 TaxID=1389203 RepID=A0A9Q3CWW1_9BASI|nr:hypothetical protein [Austropuccinia psidii MF-1]
MTRKFLVAAIGSIDYLHTTEYSTVQHLASRAVRRVSISRSRQIGIELNALGITEAPSSEALHPLLNCAVQKLSGFCGESEAFELKFKLIQFKLHMPLTRSSTLGSLCCTSDGPCLSGYAEARQTDNQTANRHKLSPLSQSLPTSNSAPGTYAVGTSVSKRPAGLMRAARPSWVPMGVVMDLSLKARLLVAGNVHRTVLYTFMTHTYKKGDASSFVQFYQLLLYISNHPSNFDFLAKERPANQQVNWLSSPSMPRQPLINKPGLPPYGQRSSERRKEQNRLAQRQLRERRQQQEVAQAQKIDQQHHEILRLHRIIRELSNQNLMMKNQSSFRRRQSVIPISSLSKGLVPPHGPSSFAGPSAPSTSSKLMYGRHSIDCSSSSVNTKDTHSALGRFNDSRLMRDWEREIEKGPRYEPAFKNINACNTLSQKARLLFPQHIPCETMINHHTGQGNGCLRQVIKEDLSQDEKMNNNMHSYDISSFTSSQEDSAAAWVSISPTTSFSETPAPTESPTHLFQTINPEALEKNCRLNSKTRSHQCFPVSVNLASFWPADPPLLFGNSDGFTASDLATFSPELITIAEQQTMNTRPQPRKTSTSASSDTSTTNSILSNHETYSPLAAINPDSLDTQFPPQELLSLQSTCSQSPNFLQTSFATPFDERVSQNSNSTIGFCSALHFTKSNDDTKPSASIPLESHEAEKVDFNPYNPIESRDMSLYTLDFNDVWASDY